ncbi:uracil-DNA glycosylase family protein [Maricaulis sp. CAU 1757]
MAAPDIDTLLRDIRACRVCAGKLPHEPRPVIQASKTARVLIVGQAPGTRVHKSGQPFTDPSGDRLRDWLGIGPDVFYDAAKVAISPMGYCFPGLDATGGDLPPRKECAPLWQSAVREQLPQLGLTLLVGLYAQKFHLASRMHKTMTETVRHAADYGPDFLPLPHPSWRNNAWLKRNPWFASEILPMLRCRIKELLG